MKFTRAFLALIAVSFSISSFAQLGVFEGTTQIGPATDGAGLQFDVANKVYSLKGGGSNMWFSADAFHFVWKKVSGDVSLAADILIPPSEGGDAHRKGVLMVRQSLDADSPYADAALHGDGLTSLQYRETKGARTYEIQSNQSKPTRLRIEKRGKYVSMSIARTGEPLRPAGGSFRLELTDPFYVGIGVCAHKENRIETAAFSNLEMTTEGPGTNLASTIEFVTVASRDRRVVFASNNRIEAPNWSKDGSKLLFNGMGRIHEVRADGTSSGVVLTDFAIRCNNDHGISPDGKTLAISDQSQGRRQSLIYTLPVEGGTPKLVTTNGPSYWHGWAPDGKSMVFCGERNGEFDVYSISANGGEETRLTTALGLDDGPEYTADGKWIYFNSDRTGRMQVWRMKPDGSGQEQVTDDEFNNWFAHPSPDGRWLVFLSYDGEVKGHPADKDVSLRIMPLAGGKIETLAKLFGGQGTINVPSWSPDSRRVAFVSYQRRP